eukprot:14995957-Alexandrium_andersonii.AAC.1
MQHAHERTALAQINRTKHAHMPPRMNVHTHEDMHACECMCTPVHALAQTCTLFHTSAHAYNYTHTHTHPLAYHND